MSENKQVAKFWQMLSREVRSAIYQRYIKELPIGELPQLKVSLEEIIKRQAL